MSSLKRQRGPTALPQPHDDGGELTASALGGAQLPALGASGALAQGRLERLEVLLRQTELLRRLDCDSHAAEKAQLECELQGLGAQVEALTAAAAQARSLAPFAGGAAAAAATAAAAAAAAGGGAGEQPGAAAAAAALRAQLQEALTERDEALGALAAQRATATAALAAGRDAVGRAEAAAAELGRQLGESRAEVRALRAAAAREKGGSTGWASVGADENGGSASSSSSSSHAGHVTAGQAAALREEVRAAQERCRLLEAQLERAAAGKRNEAILQAQVEAAGLRAGRAESAAGHANALAVRVRLLLGALEEWGGSVWGPLLGSEGEAAAAAADAAAAAAAAAGGAQLPPEHASVGEEAVVAALERARARARATARCVTALQSSQALALEECGAVHARLAAVSESRRAEAEGASALAAQLSEASRSCALEASARAVAEARLASALAHAQRLKAVCQTYEKEHSASLGAAGVADNAGRAEAAAGRVAALLEAARQGGSGGGGGGGSRGGAGSAALAEATAALQEASKSTRGAAEGVRACAQEFVRASSARLAEVEGQLRDCEARLEGLVRMGAHAVPQRVADVAAAEARTAQAHVCALKAEVAALWEKSERRGGAAGQREGAAPAASGGEGGGAAAEPPARILHLAINPTSQAFKFWDEKQRALLAALRAEVETCRAALAAGGAGRAADGASAPGSGAAAASASSSSSGSSSGSGSGSGGAGSGGGSGGGGGGGSQAAPGVLAAEQGDAKKLQQRTVEIFRERAARMRDVVNRILGWRMELDFAGAGASDQVIHIKLSSLYATSAAAQFRLKFDVAREELTVQQYAEGTDSKNFAYVQVSKSFPAFFAQCIIDEFERSTLGGFSVQQ